MTPIRRAAAIGALAATVPSLLGAQTERRTLDGDRIAIYNLVGTIRAEAGSGDRVDVTIERGGRDAGDLRINELTRDGRRILAIAYPGDRIIHREIGRRSTTMMSVGSDGTFGSDAPDRRRVRITGSGSGTEAYADLVVRVPRGRTISLHLGAGDVHVANIDGNVLVDVAAADVTTDNTTGTLGLDAGSGRATIRNARGRLALDLGSGPVVLEGVDASSVLVDAGSGSIQGAGVRARELMLDTGSGDVRLAGVSAESVLLDTGSGSVDVELASQVRSMTIDSGSGSITLRVPETFGATIEAETGSGRVDVELPMRTQRMGRDHFRGTIGDGAAQIRIDTGSGRIRIVRS